jgi:hypothetical protein
VVEEKFGSGLHARGDGDYGLGLHAHGDGCREG